MSRSVTRREFLRNTGSAAAASALTAAAIPSVHATGDDTISVALVGAGGRGTGAASDALSTQSKLGPIKMVAMADVFDKKMAGSFKHLTDSFGGQMEVTPDRKFIGVDGFKKAIDCLKKGDIAIFATPPGFRWIHFKYAIEKGVHVFMEKPVTVDGPTSRKMFQLGEEATRKNLKVGVGLMVRHCRGRMELKERIANGEIGDIISMRCYRMHPAAGSPFSTRKPEGMGNFAWQISRFHSFLWSSGGLFSDYYIHQIDECCWMKGAWPVKAHGVGGRHYRGDFVDQNFDTYAVEYTFADGTKFWVNGRHMVNCHNEMASFAHGSKGSAVISTQGHTPGMVRIWSGQDMNRKPVWAFPQEPREPNPYKMEWEDLVTAIRQDKPYNEVKRGVEASLVTSMGRMAAHTGLEISYDRMLNGDPKVPNSDHQFAPELESYGMDSEGPLPAGPDGKYPIPEPGRKTREY